MSIIHGQYRSYAALGCRCGACKAANRDYRAARRLALFHEGKLPQYKVVRKPESPAQRRAQAARYRAKMLTKSLCWRCGRTSAGPVCGVCLVLKSTAQADLRALRRSMYRIHLEGQRAHGTAVNAWMLAQRNFG